MRLFSISLLLLTINIAVAHDACVTITLQNECSSITPVEPDEPDSTDVPQTTTPEVPAPPPILPPVLTPPVMPEPPGTPTETLPLLSINNIKYQGAFTFEPNGGFTNTDGKMTLNTTTRKSLFVQGKWINTTVGEYSIPELVDSNYIPDLNEGVMLQSFVTILDRTDTPNTYHLNRVGGMQHINGELLVHLYEFYASRPPYTDTSVVFRDAANLDTSNLDGFFRFEGNSHEVLWISPIPPEYTAILGGDYISGAATNNSFSININFGSAGPSAWVFDSDDIINTTLTDADISTISLLNFGQNHIMAKTSSGWMNIKEWRPHVQYNYNGCCTLPENRTSTKDFHDNYDPKLVGDNDLWTDISGVAYGFIVPGTRTYAAFGYQAGHLRGAGYKITRKDGHPCGGPCDYDGDGENYYWFFNVDDLIDVKNGIKKSYEVKPYSYGKFTTPFDTYLNKKGITKKGTIKGGTYDTESKILYLNMPNINNDKSRYYPSAVVMAFKVDLTSAAL